MIETTRKRVCVLLPVLALAVLTLASSLAYSQDQTVKVEGVIKARSGATMILQTTEDPNLAVELTENTKVGQVQGVFKARQKSMSMAALIPGLPVKVEAFHDAQNQLVAKSVKFKGNDLQRAQNMQAGMHETKERVSATEAELGQQKETLGQHQEQLTEHQKQIAANTARFGQLADYYIMDEVTVLFGNGVTKLDPKYNAQLEDLAQKAKTIKGYMIEVKGYASSTGSAEVNQVISEKRANAVATFLLQKGHIPLTNMLAPGAMGESSQVATDNKVESEAQNRRVVVRVLQNKAIAGSE
ncbi:MAG TPA: OmpA family protein [Edaphobacter sp.]|nr:OmpA family protein [Edaphobacter sp.]